MGYSKQQPTRASVIEANRAKQAASEYDTSTILDMYRSNSLPPELQIETQHSFYYPPWAWAALKEIAKRRGKSSIQELLREMCYTVISEHETEIPKVRAQIQDIDSQVESLLILRDAKSAILDNLMKKEEVQVREQSQKELELEQAILETVDDLQMFYNRMTETHYRRLSELSGKQVSEIKAFLKETKFRPTEQQIRDFYLG